VPEEYPDEVRRDSDRPPHGRRGVTEGIRLRRVQRRDLGSTESVGLVGMRERAAPLGRSVDIRKRRPHGTLVALMIPLRPAPHVTRLTAITSC
jgi:signal transduction histidine kinase